MKTDIIKYRRLFLIFGVILSIMTLTSCDNSEAIKKEAELKQKETELAQREVSIKEREIRNPKINSTIQPVIERSQTKFLYIIIKTNQPGTKIEIINHRVTIIPVPQYYFYTSDIFEISNYSEDKKYMEIDKYEKRVKELFIAINKKFREGGNGDFNNPLFYQGDCDAKIIFKQGHVFDSYKEASIHRDANKE